MKKIQKFLKAFPYAFKGIVSGFQERNMKFHGIAALVVLWLGWYVQLDLAEWIVILVLIGLLWSAELVNTAIEELANIVRDELDLDYQATKRARDTAAGAVLVLATASVIIGSLIFIPKF
ncbi:MAG: diacylglycerol kinase family protein [Patescibacteria group bacterium]|nr:diacylglycerol kinase family protein [Patescibacteria group bacterium]